ncbi:MAG TPA: hypothetical protein VM533_16465 [Fimbriiglobus sp.]|nr:hypothetical protein [Fimbriiglobus sp.]
MADEPAPDAPEGAAVFPLIPEELGVHPLLLGVLHAYVFLEGSEPTVLHPSAAEPLNVRHQILHRLLGGAELRRVKEDLHALVGYAKHEKWPKQQVRFLQDFLKENGVEGERPA